MLLCLSLDLQWLLTWEAAKCLQPFFLLGQDALALRPANHHRNYNVLSQCSSSVGCEASAISSALSKLAVVRKEVGVEFQVLDL